MKTKSYRKVISHRPGRVPAARLSRCRCWLPLVLGLAGLGQVSRAASHTWSGAGANTNWSTAANWSAGGVPAAGESNIVLVFPSTATGRTCNVNIAGLSIDRIEVQNVLATPYTFNSGGVSVTLNGAAGENFLVSGNGSAFWYPGIVVTGTNWFNNTGTLQLRGTISGTGGLTKRGVGNLNIGPSSAANTYTGITRVSAGRLDLYKSEFVAAFAGDLVVEGGDCWTYGSNQIPDNVSITIADGELALLSDSPTTETLGYITLSGTGRLDAGLGTLVLASSVNAAAAADATIVATAGGFLSLGGGTHIFNVDQGGLLTVSAGIVDGGAAGNIIKSSPGTLRLNGSNTFTGACTVNVGVLQASSNQALGGTAGSTTVQTGATLELGQDTFNGVTLPAGETIQLAGTLRALENSTVAGSVVLSGTPVLTAASGATLTHTGVLSGAASPLTITGPGAVVLGGASSNTWSGSTEIGLTADLRLSKSAGNALPGSVKYVNSGSMTLLAANQIPDTAAVWMSAGGTFNLNGFNETVGPVYGTGLVSPIVKLGTALLTTNISAAAQLGTAAAPASIEGTDSSRFRKVGAGTFTLYQNRLDAGTTFPTLEVGAATLNLFDEWPGDIRVEAGILRGRATVGAITATSGASVCLCDFTAASYISSGISTMRADFSGSTPGATYDRMIVNEAINLGNVTLQANLLFLPYTGSQFTLIRNTGTLPVTGEFNGLPEGATLLLQGEPFIITYHGGTSGRDVVLTYRGIGTPLPEITGVQKQANGNVLVSLKGSAATGFKLYHSTTMQEGTWTLLGTVTTNAAGTASYTHAVPAAPRRFYRLGVE